MIKITKIALECLALSAILVYVDLDENTMYRLPQTMKKLAKFALHCTERRLKSNTKRLQIWMQKFSLLVQAF